MAKTALIVKMTAAEGKRGEVIEAFSSMLDHVETSYMHRSGHPIAVLVSGALMRDADGAVQAMICIAQDNRERKRHEEQVRQLAYFDAVTGHLRQRHPLQVMQDDGGLLIVGELLQRGRQPQQFLMAAGPRDRRGVVGGEVAALGTKPDGAPWRIGIENPTAGASASPALRTPPAARTAVITSGSYRHYLEAGGRRFSHIIDCFSSSCGSSS